MVKNIYVILDAKVGYGSPILDDNDEAAIRAFHYAYSDPNSMFCKYPEDYSLHRIGTYNNKDCSIDVTVPVCIAKALDFKG